MNPFIQLVTGWVQSIYYGVTIRAGDPKPAPGTHRYNQHRQRIQILVVTLYLLYTIYEADHDLQRDSTFYRDLGVTPWASERDIKSRFRRLAALHHPDKQGTAGADADSGNWFMHLKTASDTLTDPARRFAYDRFGPAVVAWHDQARCVTTRDYVTRALQTVLGPYYLGAALLLYLLGLLGYLGVGRYWRWLALAALALFELHAATRPDFPWLLRALLNPLLARLPGRAPYLPFQAVVLARKLCITLYIALNQLGGLLQQGQRLRRQQRSPGGGAGVDVEDESLSEAERLERALATLEQMAAGLDTDAGRLMELEMAPYAGDPTLREVMRPKLKDWMVQNTIFNDPMVRDAMGKWRQRRRPDAPAGARGTK